MWGFYLQFVILLLAYCFKPSVILPAERWQGSIYESNLWRLQLAGRLSCLTAMASSVARSKIFCVVVYGIGEYSVAALVDSLVDIAASLTNLLVVRYSLQPADDEHTFGHGKSGSLAALAQSMFISGSALFLFAASTSED